MKEIIITAICGMMATAISTLVTFFSTKKKYISEVQSNDIGNLRESLNFYKELSDDNTRRLEEILAKNKEFESTVLQLKTENQDLSILVNKQNIIIEELRREVKELTDNINKLIVNKK